MSWNNTVARIQAFLSCAMCAKEAQTSTSVGIRCRLGGARFPSYVQYSEREETVQEGLKLAKSLSKIKLHKNMVMYGKSVTGFIVPALLPCPCACSTSTF